MKEIAALALFLFLAWGTIYFLLVSIAELLVSAKRRRRWLRVGRQVCEAQDEARNTINEFAREAGKFRL